MGRTLRAFPLLVIGGALAVDAASGCSVSALDLSGYPCDGGECAAGYECHPTDDICVPAITRGCELEADVCWSEVSLGDFCEGDGAYLPCGDVDDCSQGCRTCDEGLWSDCEGGPACETGTVDDCAACGDNCAVLITHATATCDTSGATPVCDYSGDCAGTYVDADGDRGNGCECLPNAGGEVCDGDDDDCNGSVDDIDALALAAECDAAVLAASGNPAQVNLWTCAGGCAIEACAGGYHDVDDDATNGCEYACTPDVPPDESCDGSDDDCDGLVDNLDPAQLDADCAAQHPSALDVSAWSCDAAACAIAGCVTGKTNLNGDLDDGCEEDCAETNGGQEICDGLDNDCNGTADDAPAGATDCVDFYLDVDDDGYGVTGDAQCLCVATGDYRATVAGDCDDEAATCTLVCADVDLDLVADCQDHCIDEDVDGLGNADSDNSDCLATDVDGVVDNPNLCADTDGDGCDDCVGGSFAPNADGTDTDSDGDCDDGDEDDDNDGVLDGPDTDDLDPLRCADADSDGCDDCAVGVDGFGASPDFNPAADGPDGDGDGWCDSGDCEPGEASVNPDGVEGPAGDPTCADAFDNDCDTATNAADIDCTWWDFAWGARVRLDFLNVAPPASLSPQAALDDFPVLVIIDGSNVPYAKTDASGEDIRFVDADYQTALAYEIEEWDESGVSYVWVRVPRIDANSTTDHIYLYYDNPGVGDAQNAAGVWDTNYVAVWHLRESANDADPAFKDSSSGGGYNDLIDYGGMDGGDRVVGPIGYAAHFDGSNDRLEMTSASLNFSGQVNYTVSVWFYNDAAPRTWQGLVSKGNSQQYAVSLNRTNLFIHYETNQSTPAATPLNSANGSVAADTTQFVAIRYDGTDKKTFIDGQQAASAAYTVDSAANTQAIRVARGNDGEYYAGIIDEVRISNIERSPSYIWAQWLCGTDAFVVFNSEETR